MRPAARLASPSLLHVASAYAGESPGSGRPGRGRRSRQCGGEEDGVERAAAAAPRSHRRHHRRRRVVAGASRFGGARVAQVGIVGLPQVPLRWLRPVPTGGINCASSAIAAGF